MKIGGAFGLAAAFWCWMVCAPASAARDVPLAETLSKIQQAFVRHDCTSALPLARRLRDSRSEASADDLMRLNSVIVACEADSDTAQMYRDALRATASEPSSIYVWRVRLSYEITENRSDAALETIDLMARSHQAALNAVPIRAMFELHQRLDKAGKDTDDLRLLKALNSAYQPVEPFAEVEALRLAYARKLFDKGDVAAATDLINGIQTFWGLVQVSTDPDFRALQNPKVDFSVAAERQLVEDQITLSQHGDSLEGVVRVADDLRRLGRYLEALSVLESVRSRIGNPNSFTDHNFQQAWWWNGLAQVHTQLGDYDHSVESYRGAIASGESGRPNVSQLLNLASNQIRFGHYQDALATLASAPDVPQSRSAYGDMVFHYAHGCAATLAGHKENAASDISYVAAHEKDGPGPAAELLSCAGNIDGAAAVFIRQLNDPKKRPAALQTLSDFRPNPPNVPETPAEQRLPEIKARADVKAAIAKAGGIQSFPFRRDDL
jgi:tetratricopeptide (TPR) repeat protein